MSFSQSYYYSRYLTFLTDLQPPVIHQIADATVKCGDPFGPDVTGRPGVSDIRDPKPSLTYRDETLGGCGMSRIWTAADEAGNIAKFNQTIYFTSPRAPEVRSEFLITS